MTETQPSAIGADLPRLDGHAKVTGTAPYAYDQVVEAPTYLHAVQASIARGAVSAIDTEAAEALEGVVCVLTPTNAPRLASTEDAELAVLQSPDVAFRGQIIGAVVAESPEIARQASRLLRVTYSEEPHDVELDSTRDDLYAPDTVNPDFPTDTNTGNVESALASAPVTVDETYSTAMNHNNPMEPHATIAIWDDDGLTLYDSTQGVHSVRAEVAEVFGLDEHRVRVIAPHVGGGFGSKGTVHANVILAVLASQRTGGRPVKFALTRQQMFSLVGYRTPTIQRVRLAADREGHLLAISNDVVEQTSRIKEFAEQSGVPTRNMYRAPSRRTTHRLAALDVPVPSWMRAPGECPGMFGPEVAVDELSCACGIDPIELRVRNEPELDPESGLPFSSRDVVGCLRDGARRFGWHDRDPRPGVRREHDWLVGTGVACSTYPVNRMPGSAATIRFSGGRYEVSIGAVDIGTGTWTALTQIAADSLGVPVDAVDVRIGDTALPSASVEGGSSGMTCWGSAIADAAQRFRAAHGSEPADGDEAEGEIRDNPDVKRFAMHAFGAQFAEVRVHVASGEVRVPRLLGVFAVGRIINPRTARSQLVGGMTMGLSMALHEDSVRDPHLGHVINHDFAQYHIATNADAESIDAHWLDEHDPHVNPMGSKGIGEIGIVGTAAAVVNAAHHATGMRVRALPLTPEKFLR